MHERGGFTRRSALAMLVASAAMAHGALAQDRIRRIGVFTDGSDDGSDLVPLLAELGHRKVQIVARGAQTAAQIDAAAADLVRANVDALYAFGTLRTLALTRATQTIPIVCTGIPDPVEAGLVESIRRPGRNVTGLSMGLPEFAELEVGLLRTLLPKVARIVGATVQGRERGVRVTHRSLEEAAKRAGIAWDYVTVETVADYETLFASFRDPGTVAVKLFFWPGIPDPAPLKAITALAIRQRIALISGGGITPAGPEIVRQGALLLYVRDFADMARRVAALLDKVLRGTNPADIPFELPDRTYLMLNRATARAIGLAVPAELILRATEVID